MFDVLFIVGKIINLVLIFVIRFWSRGEVIPQKNILLMGLFPILNPDFKYTFFTVIPYMIQCQNVFGIIDLT